MWGGKHVLAYPTSIILNLKDNKMTTDFTKIKWAGSEHILVTIREKCREPILILDENDIKRLYQEWNGVKE